MWRIALLLVVLGPAWVSAEPAKRSPAELAKVIDQRLREKWDQVVPAPAADDAEFFRRLSLDLNGRIPRVSEVRGFLTDAAVDKRAKAIEKMLASPQYAGHLGGVWSALLVATNNQNPFGDVQFRRWMEQNLADNRPFDAIVRELLTVPVGVNAGIRRPVNYNPYAANMSPIGFYTANAFKPENVAASVSRVFLGVKLECAQCHDHPFARWSRQQFWELAAFFPTIQPQAARVVAGQPPKQPPPVKDREIKIMGTEKVVQARFLDGTEPKWTDKDDTRAILADWLASPKNAFFARTAVNRTWVHFFGHGLIDPVDEEPTDESPASHPELLNELAEQFTANGFDLKYLIRAITLSDAYQRTSRQTHPSQGEPRRFARMTVRGLTAEQLFDSVAMATGYRAPNAQAYQQFVFDNNRIDFLNRFGSQERTIEKQTSIQQALAMMNGKLVGDATSLQRSRTLAAIVEAPFLVDTEKVEALFLATLSRMPRSEELERFVTHLSDRNHPSALADLLWVLLNCSEFSVNH